MNLKKKNIRSHPLFAAAIAVLCTILWGSAFPAIKLGYQWFRIGDEDIPSKLVFAGGRFLLAGVIVLCLGILTTKNKHSILLKKHDLLPIMLLGFVQTFCQYLLLYIGLTRVTGTKSALLTSVSAFGSVLLSPLFWKNDSLTLRKLLGCLTGLCGILVMNIEGGGLLGFTLLGDGLVILSNLAGAFGNIISKKISGERHPSQIAGWQLTLGGTALLIAGLLPGGRLVFYDWRCAGILLYLGAMAGIAFMLWTMLLFYHPVSKIAVYNLLIPVFGTLWSGIFLQENIFTIPNISALVLVCSGIFFANAPAGKSSGLSKD